MRNILKSMLLSFFNISLFNDADFIWMIHPISIDDIFRRYKLLKFFPKKFIYFLLEIMPPMLLSEVENVISFTGRKKRGYIMGCFLTPKSMHNNKEMVVRKVYKGAKIARSLNSKFLVIGGMISIDKENEKKINSIYGISLANGSATSTMIMDIRIAGILKKLGLAYNDISLSIINASSLKGSLISEFFSQYNFRKILLLDKNKEKLLSLKNKIKKDVHISTDLNELVDSDLIIIAPAYNRVELKSDYFKDGVMIYDINDPHYDFDKIMDKVKIKVYSNGLININNISYNYDLGIPESMAYACLVESFLLSMADSDSLNYCNCVTLNEIKQVKEYFNKSNLSLSE